MNKTDWPPYPEDWKRLEAPLLNLDIDLNNFCSKYELRITKNQKQWPERSIQFGDKVRCLIQIYLDNSETLDLNFWICASQDRNLKRYWKNEFLRKSVNSEDLQLEIENLLEEAKVKLDLWRKNESILEFATNISRVED